MSNEKTNVAEFVSELQAGVFEQQIATAINSVAGATVEHGRGGEVVIKLKFKHIPNTTQVNIEHSLSFKRPTKRGSSSEDLTYDTPMYVGKGGKVTIFPQDQMDMLNPQAKA